MGMPVPDWAQDDKMREELFKQVQAPAKAHDGKFRVHDLTVVDSFSTFFAEWKLRGDDIVMHLYPRAGAEDRWTQGHYLPRCANCKAEVPMPKTISELKPCDHCGKTRLIYVPGRGEDRSQLRFPGKPVELILAAANKVWDGEVAIEPVPELDNGAFVTQFQGAASLPAKALLDDGGFLDRFFSAFDELLEPSSKS